MAIDETEPARRFRIIPTRRSRGHLELELRCLMRVARVLRREIRSRRRLSWTERLNARRLGFTSDGWRPYKGRLVDVQGRLQGSTGEGLAALFADAASLVFRPDWSGGGEGVFFVGSTAGAADLTINGRPATRSEVEALVSGLDRYLLTPFVQQATYAEEIWLRHHPETGRPIEGVRIPGLEPTLAGILRAALCFPGAGCIGWDAVITEDAFHILEANAPPGLYVRQVHAPLLADQRVARFFASHGIRVPSRGAKRAPDPR